MSALKTALGRLWAVWGLITFVTTFLIFFLPSMACYLIPGKRGQAIFIGIAKVWNSIWLVLVGCPIRVTGEEHFAGSGPFVVTANHNALLDVPILCPFVPGANKTIAKDSFMKVPLFGWYYAKGAVLVNRNDTRSRVKSFDDMRKVLQADMHMCIFPEGTRNRTGEPLKEFYDGAFRLAAKTKKAVIPTIITGTREAMPAEKGFYLWPHRVSINFLPPVSSEGKSADALKNEVFEVMREGYLRLNK